LLEIGISGFGLLGTDDAELLNVSLYFLTILQSSEVTQSKGIPILFSVGKRPVLILH
jgi:hypothetical protein